jgi:hypothetical protein
MEKVLRCDCGFEVRAGDDEVLVSRAREHARKVHGMEFTAEQVLQLAMPAESTDGSPAATSLAGPDRPERNEP